VGMKANRSIPVPTVVPILTYPDVRAAVAWLAAAYGFEERVKIGEDHRAQLRLGSGALIVADVRNERHPARPDDVTHTVLVRVADARDHCERARANGAEIRLEPTDWEYGERQYEAVDPYGHHWTFSETLIDRAPEEWGGEYVIAAPLAADDPVATAAVTAIRTGEVDALRRLLRDHARLIIGNGKGLRTLLHVATDWPGHFPNVAETVRVLVGAGAEVNAHFLGGRHQETPLHWAASSDDVEALDALLDLGADIDAPGAVIAGLTPLADARSFRNWRAAERLVERGAQVSLGDAATMGLLDKVRSFYAGEPAPAKDDTDKAFWHACHGGRREVAEYLLSKGADVDFVPPWEPLSPLDAAVRSEETAVADWLRSKGATSASA
jgi:uncharacterized glyoxalase superfamily protein PhnB